MVVRLHFNSRGLYDEMVSLRFKLAELYQPHIVEDLRTSFVGMNADPPLAQYLVFRTIFSVDTERKQLRLWIILSNQVMIFVQEAS